jgi:hypothetical protein
MNLVGRLTLLFTKKKIRVDFDVCGVQNLDTRLSRAGQYREGVGLLSFNPPAKKENNPSLPKNYTTEEIRKKVYGGKKQTKLSSL